MSKKIFIISGAIFVALLAVSAGIYFFSTKKTNKPAVETNTNPSISEIKDDGSKASSIGKIKKLVDGLVQGVVLDESGTKAIYYQNSNFIALDLASLAKNPLGAYPFNNAKSILWSKDKKEAIVKSEDGYLVYNLDSDQVTKLKPGVDIAVWNKAGDKIVYKYFDKTANQRSINVADPDGENWNIIKPIDWKLVDFQINPATGEIGYFPTPDSYTSSQLFGLGQDGNGERKIVEGKFGADYLWSPDGKSLLVSFVTEKGGKNMELGVANQAGGEYRTLGFPSTVRKCVWSNDNVEVYCAMVSGLADGSVMPNDWADKKISSVDTFWKINTKNGKKERILAPSEITETLDAENLILDKEEKVLLLTDRKSGGLYEIQL